MPEHQQTQYSIKSKSVIRKQIPLSKQALVSNLIAIIQCARINPKSFTQAGIMQLRRTIENRAVGRLLTEIGFIISKTEQAHLIK